MLEYRHPTNSYFCIQYVNIVLRKRTISTIRHDILGRTLKLLLNKQIIQSSRFNIYNND